ncbi:RDD family protein [Motilimonas pumila]|nr:RDD family protein [Motilimonas pumila]
MKVTNKNEASRKAVNTSIAQKKNYTVALLRIPAFLLDCVFVLSPLVVLGKLHSESGAYISQMPVGWIGFVYIPMAFFIYWACNLNLGKRIFRLVIVDAHSDKPATVWQLFKRSLLLSLVVPFNMAFLIPLFASKRQQSFHDMFASTRVIRKLPAS